MGDLVTWLATGFVKARKMHGSQIRRQAFVVPDPCVFVFLIIFRDMLHFIAKAPRLSSAHQLQLRVVK